MLAGMITNGYLLTPQRVNQLNDAGLDHIQVSIQAPKRELADRIAGTDVHEKKRDALRRIAQRNVALTLNSVLHRLNLPPTASHELIASRLQQANPHLPKWKKLAQRFDSPDYMDGLPPSGWLRVAKDLIEIKSAMA